MFNENSFRYKVFHDAVADGVLSSDELLAYQEAAEDGTVAGLLAGWSSTHSNADFREICLNTAMLLGWKTE